MARPQKYTTKEIIDALKKTKGAIYLASELLGCHADTIYERAKKSPQVQKTIDSYRGKLLDVAELKLLQAVNNGESWAIAFCLKSIGRDRGYGDRIDLMMQLGLNTETLRTLKQHADSAGVPLSEVFEAMINELSGTYAATDRAE